MNEFDDYAGLLAEQGDFDIPANWVAGIAIRPTEKVDFTIDVQQVLYSNGFSRLISNTLEISLAVMRASSHAVKGANPLEAPGLQTIEPEMDR